MITLTCILTSPAALSERIRETRRTEESARERPALVPAYRFRFAVALRAQAVRAAPRVAHAVWRVGALRRRRHRRVLLDRPARVLTHHEGRDRYLPRPHADHRRRGYGHEPRRP